MTDLQLAIAAAMTILAAPAALFLGVAVAGLWWKFMRDAFEFAVNEYRRSRK